jgi:Fe-Mn family superoxide dismutase
MAFELPPLDFPYDALEPYIDEATMRIHHDKHHAAYVKNLNDAIDGHTGLMEMEIEELLTALNRVPEEILNKVANNGGGHANHSFFWKLLSPSGAKPTKVLRVALETTFGSVASFKEKFTEAALGRFGSGWAWLVADKKGQLAIESTANQDSPIVSGKIPLLTLDVWEHAYYLKYQNRRADYVAAWWNVVNWKQVELNLKKA